MALELSVPSKTFVVGEYVALTGGPCLIAATGPRFRLKVSLNGQGRLFGIHPESPAGVWVRKHFLSFQDIDIEFVDPHNGRGGLGASSAQFILVHAWSQLSSKNIFEIGRQLNIRQIWQDYRDVTRTVGEIEPSGADVVAQVVGGLCGFSFSPFEVKRLEWKFEDLRFAIFRTGNKISTHVHLEDLELGSIEVLKGCAESAIVALAEDDPFMFMKSTGRFYKELLQKGLVCDETKELVDSLSLSGSVISAKGCGALGADTIFVLCEKENIERLKSLVEVVGLEWIGGFEELSSGLEVRFDIGEATVDVQSEKRESKIEFNPDSGLSSSVSAEF